MDTTSLTNTAGTTYYWAVTPVDTNGVSGTRSDIYSFTLDTTAPTGSIVINDGVEATVSTDITLTLSATDAVGVTGYCAKELSTTPSSNDTCWTAVTSTTSYSATVAFTLSSGDGTKTVYVWFKDSVGNVSVLASDSITLTTTVTDIDGNIYNMVTIGTQVWMKENLKVTKYRNGDAIPTTTSSISNDSSSKYQWAYDNNESNVTTYGRLYTWYAATDSRGVCPTGWHLPTDAEWTTLTDYLGGASVAGGKMKEAGTTHWSSPNISADNSSGFTALPGGYREILINNGPFNSMGLSGYWWSATEYTATCCARYRYLYYDYADVYRLYSNNSQGLSVRCVRD